MKAIPYAFAAGVVIALSCKSPSPTPQGIVVANIEPSEVNLVGCAPAGPFLWIPQCNPVTQCNGPDTGNDANMTPSGTNGFQIAQCSIVPQAGNYAVSITMRADDEPGSNPYGPFPSVVEIDGIFPTRASTGGLPIPNVTMEYDVTMKMPDEQVPLVQHTCTASYVYSDNGSPGSPLPAAADTSVDGNGGSIWVSVFCDGATNLVPTVSGMNGCALSVTLRLEGCSTTL